MTQLEKSLRAKAEAATPGAWIASDPDTRHYEVCTTTGRTYWVAECDDQHNTDYIAAANPQTILKLLEALRLAREGLEEEDCDCGGDDGYCDGYETPPCPRCVTLDAMDAVLEGK